MVMKENQLDSQVDKLLSEIKLKEPRKEEMTDYLSKVRLKIDERKSHPQNYFFPLGVAFALTFAIYFMVQVQPKKEPTLFQTAQKVSEPGTGKKFQKSLSLEEEMAVLEAFSEEYPAGTSDLLGDDETMNDLVLMDEIDFSSFAPGTPQNA